MMDASSLQLRVHGIDRWREFVQSMFLDLDCRADRPASFEGSTLATSVGDARAADLRVTASEVRRRRRDAENDASPCFKVLWQLAGHSRIQQGRNEATLPAGTWSIYDTSREYTIESSDQTRLLVLLMPQLQCPSWRVPVRELAGSAIACGGASHIALSTLSGLVRDDTPLDAATQQIVQSSTVALVERALWNELERRGLDTLSSERPTLERVQAFILERLADPALTPEAVGAMFGICRRTLYSLFDRNDTTPRAFIQHARLERAAALLRDVAWREASVNDIARHCGIANAATFSRTFHEHFGVTPSVWRKEGPSDR